MPKYYEFLVAGYYLYFTSHSVIECMHVHGLYREWRLNRKGSPMFFGHDLIRCLEKIVPGFSPVRFESMKLYCASQS